MSDLVQRHNERLVHLLAKGYTRPECARAMDLSLRRVGQIIQEDPGIRDRARALADENDPTTVEVLRRLMLTSRDEKVQLAAAIALRRDPPPSATDEQDRIVTLIVHRDGETGVETVTVEPPAEPAEPYVSSAYLPDV